MSLSNQRHRANCAAISHISHIIIDTNFLVRLYIDLGRLPPRMKVDKCNKKLQTMCPQIPFPLHVSCVFGPIPPPPAPTRSSISYYLIQKQAPVSGASLAMMQEYLKDPARIIYACWDHDDIIPMGDGMFRMVFSGQNFLSVSIDLSVDIKLRVDENGNILCKSIGYSVEDMAKLLGQEFVDTFFLELEGELRVEESVTKVRALTLKGTLLSGDVGVTVGGKVRSNFCPRPNYIFTCTPDSTYLNQHIPSARAGHQPKIKRVD